MYIVYWLDGSGERQEKAFASLHDAERAKAELEKRFDGVEIVWEFDPDAI